MKLRHEALEAHYQKFPPDGPAVDWGGRAFDQFLTRPFLDKVLPTLGFTAPHPIVLEYGTGTGAGACYLAARGFQVDAMDLSPTAIKLARKNAAQRDLLIHFEAGDILDYAPPHPVYDLIVDNFCLHFIVTEADRGRLYQKIRAWLKPAGYFLIGTTLYQEDRDMGEDLFEEETGIRYQKVDAHQGYEDAVRRGNNWFVPVRRYLRPGALRAEVEQAGFQVRFQDGGRLVCYHAFGK